MHAIQKMDDGDAVLQILILNHGGEKFLLLSQVVEVLGKRLAAPLRRVALKKNTKANVKKAAAAKGIKTTARSKFLLVDEVLVETFRAHAATIKDKNARCISNAFIQNLTSGPEI